MAFFVAGGFGAKNLREAYLVIIRRKDFIPDKVLPSIDKDGALF
jgi:hypothetical protein